MKPGRELDVMIAEKVMGFMRRENPTCWVLNPKVSYCDWWTIAGHKRGDEGQHSGPLAKTLPHYSTKIEAAWEVVEKLKHLNFMIQFDQGELHEWVAEFLQNGKECTGVSNSAPHAICLAALAVVGEK